MSTILKAVKVSMIQPKTLSVMDKFKISVDAGFDGISLFGPGQFVTKEVWAAQDKTGLPVHNVNVWDHWKVRLSDADPAVREAALKNMTGAMEFANDVGASTILSVIGKVTDPKTENHDQVWERSSEQIQKALPTAARLGIRIQVENVGNDFCRTIPLWNKYIDQFNSSWVGTFFDIGNYDQIEGGAPTWIRSLGSRISKIDVKGRDYAKNKNCNLTEGNVDWPDVRKALDEIGFNGWATAEVRGGDLKRLTQVVQRMDQVLGIT